MDSMFTLGFQKDLWRPAMAGSKLGQFGIPWAAIAPALISAGATVYGSYQQRETAKDIQEAAEDKAAADQARADAARAKAEEEKKKAVQATQAAEQAAVGTVLGVPKQYLIYGGLGLAAVGVIGAAFMLLTKK